ncbi:ribonuclease III [Candidatus Parcubacteria bacterium]|nr:ribonuclease III [Patescibacteria group bacterium]MCG2688956.1 ribonuclease III [Candidatus Parcubacteria bacterium]
MIIDFLDLEKTLNLQFTNKNLLKTAFTHRSYLNECRDQNIESNERLEFLGDSVLQFLTSKLLYAKYQNQPEGILTSYRAAIVNTTSLAQEALRLNLGKYLLMSKGEEATGGRTRPYIMANTFEALLGTMFLEFNSLTSGLDICEKFLYKELFYKIESIVKDKKYRDPKSYLQEITQEKFSVTPLYKVLNEEGPDHNKVFTVGVFLNTKQLSQGQGSSKQKAEERAAQKAVVELTSK